MSEDTTQGLPPRPFEERVLDELSAMRQELTTVKQELTTVNSRMSALEEKVDRRLQETRPIWEGVLEQLKEINARLDRIEAVLSVECGA